jgi:hypothetical protein
MDALGFTGQKYVYLAATLFIIVPSPDLTIYLPEKSKDERRMNEGSLTDD